MKIRNIVFEHITYKNYIYLYIFLMPWNFFKPQMGLLTGILLIWWLVIGKREGYFKKLSLIFQFKPLVVFIGFLVFCYASLLWSTNHTYGIENTLNFYKYYWFMIPVLFTSLSKEDAINGFYMLIFSLGTYAIFSLVIYLDVITVKGSPSGNPRGILAAAIVTPYMVIGFLSSLLICFFSKKIMIKRIFILIAFLCFIGVFINLGRAGHLSLFFTSIVLVVLYRKIIGLKYISIGVLVCMSLLVVLFSTNKLVRIEKGINEVVYAVQNDFEGGWGHRAYMWYAASNMLEKHPFIGVGVGDNIDEFIEYGNNNPSKAVWLRSFHNQHLDYLTKYGVLGYSMLLISVFYLLAGLKSSELYFSVGVAFFSVVFFDSLGDILLLMKPFNNIFMLVFLLLSIIAYDEAKRVKTESKY